MGESLNNISELELMRETITKMESTEGGSGADGIMEIDNILVIGDLRLPINLYL